MSFPSPAQAVERIRKRGALLVYPLANRREPASLWSEFFPRSPMKWDWDAGADARVARLWHLREQVSRSGKVVYAKWFRGRATFFSLPLFEALLASLAPGDPYALPLSETARLIWETLEMESPLSTKELKVRCGLRGKANESLFHRATAELWERGLIIGYGEVDDGAFPSLAVASTRAFFPKVWEGSRGLSEATAEAQIRRGLPADSPFLAHWERLRRRFASPAPLC